MILKGYRCPEEGRQQNLGEEDPPDGRFFDLPVGAPVPLVLLPDPLVLIQLSDTVFCYPLVVLSKMCVYHKTSFDGMNVTECKIKWCVGRSIFDAKYHGITEAKCFCCLFLLGQSPHRFVEERGAEGGDVGLGFGGLKRHC